MPRISELVGMCQEGYQGSRDDLLWKGLRGELSGSKANVGDTGQKRIVASTPVMLGANLMFFAWRTACLILADAQDRKSCRRGQIKPAGIPADGSCCSTPQGNELVIVAAVSIQHRPPVTVL